MTIIVPLASSLHFFFLPRSQTAQTAMEERLWARSSGEIARMDKVLASVEAENKELRSSLHDLQVGVTTLTTQLIENGHIPRWPPDMPHPKSETTIKIDAGVSVQGDVTGRDKREGGVDFNSDVSQTSNASD